LDIIELGGFWVVGLFLVAVENYVEISEVANFTYPKVPAGRIRVVKKRRWNLRLSGVNTGLNHWL
jgi:hypothetical protein